MYVSNIEQRRLCVLSAFQHGLHELDETSVLRLFQPPQQPILHDCNEFFVAQLSVLWEVFRIKNHFADRSTWKSYDSRRKSWRRRGSRDHSTRHAQRFVPRASEWPRLSKHRLCDRKSVRCRRRWCCWGSGRSLSSLPSIFLVRGLWNWNKNWKKNVLHCTRLD